MDLSTAWILPVTFIPGLGLLVMSTIHKRGYIAQSISDYKMHGQKMAREILDLQNRRLELIHRTLTSLYLGISAFGLGSLFGGLTSFWPELSMIVLSVLMVSGIFFLTIATIILIFESSYATRAMKLECHDTILSMNPESSPLPPPLKQGPEA